jgi:SBP domain
VCTEHQTAPQVLLGDGTLGRVCKRCHTLHALSEFDGNLRTCASSLALHNARRRLRKTQAAANNTVAGIERAGGSNTNQEASSTPSEPGSPETQPSSGATPPTDPGAPTLLLRPRAAGGSLGADVMAILALQRFTIEVKLPACSTPAALPSGDVLADALQACLGSNSSLIDTACVSIAPGCVRLIVDALLDTNAAPAQEQATAQQLANVLKRRGGAAARGARVAGMCHEAAPASLFPLAALLLPPAGSSTGDDDVTVPATCVLPAGAAHLAVRCRGRHVRCTGAGQLTLQSSAVPHAGGCLLVEARGSDGERLHRPRAVVASRDAAMVTELNEAYQRGVVPEHVMQAMLHVIGDALTLRAVWEVRCAAAKAAARAGWSATLRALCAGAESYQPGGGDEVAVAASAHVDAASSISVLHAVAPAAAWKEAARRLRSALVAADPVEVPHCAAFLALRDAQSDVNAPAAAVRVLRAAAAVLQRAAEDAVDVALDVDDNAIELAEFEAFRALRGSQECFLSHALSLLSCLVRLHKTMTLLSRPSWPSDAELGSSGSSILRGFRLHPRTPGAPPVEVRSVPWQDVLIGLRWYAMYSVLFLYPFHLAAFYFSWRLRNGHVPPVRVYYGVLAYWFAAVWVTGHLVCDLCILYATGGAPEWPTGIPTLLHAAFIFWIWRKPLFNPPVIRMIMAWCACCYFSTLLAVAGPRVVFTNEANVAVASVLMFVAVRAGPRERALKAAFASSKKLKQA